MHDPTEAGVVGALWEMAEASGCGFRVAVGAFPFGAPTRAICAALGVDPLRLIASGALLIACLTARAMVDGLAARGIEAAHIGEVTTGVGRVLVRCRRHWRRVAAVGRDELYRVLEELS